MWPYEDGRPTPVLINFSDYHHILKCKILELEAIDWKFLEGRHHILPFS